MAGNVHETWSCNYLCFLRSSSALIKVMLTQEGRIFEVETKLFIRESWDFFLLWITILFWKHGEYVLSSVCKKKRCYFQWEVVFSVSCVWKFPHNVFLKQLSTLFFYKWFHKAENKNIWAWKKKLLSQFPQLLSSQYTREDPVTREDPFARAAKSGETLVLKSLSAWQKLPCHYWNGPTWATKNGRGKRGIWPHSDKLFPLCLSLMQILRISRALPCDSPLTEPYEQQLPRVRLYARKYLK